MGVETRKAYLPAPTDSPTEQTPGESSTEADLATDVSRRTDKTSWTIPEDGREITIPAKRRKDRRNTESRLTKGSDQSQTSLLIEYFEGGKSAKVSSRPSVRVKVTPSAARKIKDTNEHITVSESVGGRKPSYTRRISLGPQTPTDRQITESADDNSSYASAAEESSLAPRKPPVEIEVMGHAQDSDLSSRSDDRDRLVQQNPSEISSMPPDSMLDETQGNVKITTVSTPRHRSRSTSREVTVNPKDTLTTPSRTRSGRSRERLAHKAMEKIAAQSGSSGRHRRHSKTSRSRSASSEQAETLKSSKRRSSKTHRYEEESRSGNESSALADSQLSPKRGSGDQYSFRSGASRSSVSTNPALLEHVEKAIKRYIMPEIESIKREQKVQSTKSKFEQESVTSGGSERGSRRLSSHRSTPDITEKPKVVLNRDGDDPGTILSGDSVKGRKERRRSSKSDSPRERRSERELSEETVIHDGGSASRKRSNELTAIGKVGGVLTAAALSHHDLKHSDSRSTVDSKERRRRRRSKSHSRSASIAESEDAFKKHDIPPMPMQSDIHSSDITRDSILSDETSGTRSPAVEVQHATIRQLARASPREISSPRSRTPTRGQKSLQKSMGTHHSNLSQGDLAPDSPLSDRSAREKELRLKHEKPSIFGGSPKAAGPPVLATQQFPRYDDEDTYAHQSHPLSPIQSEASREGSLAEPHRKKSATSVQSETSVASAAFDRTNRPKGIHLESPRAVLDQHNLRESDYFEGGKDPAVDEWLQHEHEKNEQYRSSIGGESYEEPTVDYRHMTNFTDDSNDATFLDRVTDGKQHREVEARKTADYRATPVAVESAVASLLDTSVVSARSKQGDRSFIDSPDKEAPRDSTYSASREIRSQDKLRPDEQPISREKSFLRDESAQPSPRQSIARSEASEKIQMGANYLPAADDPMPEFVPGMGSGSENSLETNPSIIQGPMEGTPHGNRDHWPYKPTPPQPQQTYPTSNQSSAHQSLENAATRFLDVADIAAGQKAVNNLPRSQDWSLKDEYRARAEDGDSLVDGRGSVPKDEGYVTDVRRDMQSPGVAFKDAASFDDGGLDIDDPFTGSGHARHLSTNSGLVQGESPIYDSATGNGLDRIQSKDIVALMDHLTVRDAQRNARDTEILVTLVRSAAEMRNSFEEMKKFVSEQGDVLVDANNKQHDRTIQKLIIGGPRPPPPNFSRKNSGDEEEVAAKKQNVLRRAIRGLGGRNQNDMERIQQMLNHLLEEVADLKTAQSYEPSAGRSNGPSRGPSRTDTLSSYDKLRAADPETAPAQATGGMSSGQFSGYFSGSPSRGPSAVQEMRDRQASNNRVSTVLEADEELDDHEQNVLNNQFENNEKLLTPTKDRPYPGSDPLGTPPQHQLQAAAATKSVENTPKSSTDKSNKHKSVSSSIFPKVSRWSRTTASSFGDTFRKSTGRERPLSEASRSGDLPIYDNNDRYEPQDEDRIHSNGSVREDQLDQQSQQDQQGQQDQYEELSEEEEQENRPPSPLIPSQVSEDPKYQAHRDSMNLQHPQPRQGPTRRYQNHLESQAQTYGSHANSRSPISPTSDTFGSDPALARFMPGTTNRYSTGSRLSPISSNGSVRSASEQVAAAPPRPPKVKDDGPLIPSNIESGPARPPKQRTNDNKPHFASPLRQSQERLGPEQRWSGGSAADEAKRSPSGVAPPQRKPTGPRPISTSGNYSPEKDAARRTKYRGSPNAIDVSEGEGSETF